MAPTAKGPPFPTVLPSGAPGNGDKFMRGKDLKPNPAVIRVATSEEAAPDLQRTVFSNCTSPVVLWQR